EESGPVFAEAEPVVRKAAILAKSGEVSTEELAKLFISLKKTGGWDGLTELIYNTATSLNGFDKHGHFGRILVTLSTCVQYEANIEGYSGCVANFHGPQANQNTETSTSALIKLINEEWTKSGRGEAESTPAATPGLGNAEAAEADEAAAGPGPAERGGKKSAPEPALGEAKRTEGGTAPLLNYLLGQGE
ncbi:MAG TPA: hypothetical protein VIJ21_00720, partial [Solirubrobacterales bacterium]